MLSCFAVTGGFLVAKKYKNKMIGISSLLDNLLESRKWRSNMNRHRLFEFWAQAVGKDISANAQPKVLRGNVLWVDVTDSVWMQQLHLMKEHLRQVINDRLGEEGIKDIRFNLVNRLKPVLKAKKEGKGKPAANKPDPNKLAEFEKMICVIEDEGARNSLRKLWLIQQDRK
jgi:predicted nucleic acid-binding Zn ribbon protein